MAITIDLTNFRDRQGSRVPEGDYLVSVDDIEVGETRKGDTMLTVYLKIIGGDQDGQNIIDRLTLSEKAMFRVVGFLNGLGVKTPRKRISIDPQRLVGKKVQVTVADGEPYNGTVRSEVKSYQRVVGRKTAEESSDLDDIDDTADAPEEEQEVDNSPAETKKASQEASGVVDDGELDLDDLDV